MKPETKLNLIIDWSEPDVFSHINNVMFTKYVHAARLNYTECIGLMSASINKVKINSLINSVIVKLHIMLCFLFLSMVSVAQSWNEKTLVFQIGVGESATFNSLVKDAPSKYTSKNTNNLGKINIKSTPTFFVKFETALNKYIGLGVVIGYRKTEVNQTIPYTY